MINIIGTITGSSGYASHTKQLANALSKITDVRLSTQIPAGTEQTLSDKELELIKTPAQDNEINLIITNPVYWRLHTNAKRNWVYMIWEGDSIPQHYLEECLNPKIDLIFVPSMHTRTAILNTTRGTTTTKEQQIIYDKIRVIPHGANLDLFYPKEVKRTKFTFLCNKGFRNLEDRGGIQYAVQSYLEEFTSKDNVLLTLKLNPAYGIPNVNEMIKQLTPQGKKDFPPIRLSADNMPFDKLVNIYNDCDVFISPTRAESFNLPCIEAMACEKPVITTDFGGQNDFCNDDNSWIVGGKLNEVEHELQYEDVKWLTPSITDLRAKMRYTYEHQEEVKEKGRKSLYTAKQFTWDNSAKKIKELI